MKIKREVVLESCKLHQPNVCYIRFRKSKGGLKSQARTDVVVDYDEKGNLVGIEFYDGLPLKLKEKVEVEE